MNSEKLVKFTEFVKKRNFVIAISVFALTMVSIGFSYASFFSVKTNATNQKITTGTLAVSYGNNSSSITKNNMEPMSDKDGMAQSDASVVYIQNTGVLDAKFTLTLGYDIANFTGRSGYSSSDVLTPLDYVRFAIYEYNGAGQSDTLIAGPLSVTDLPIYTLTTDSKNNRYSAIVGSVGGTSSSSATKTYKIKTWLSESATAAASYTYFYINSDVVAEVSGAKMGYNIVGKIDGTNAANAIVAFHNYSQSVTTDENGGFTLTDVSPGTYNLQIATNAGLYSGNITVAEGDAVSVASMGSSYSDLNIYNAAYQYGTTISKILAQNSVNTIASEADLTSGKLPATYKIVGGKSDTINIGIALNTSTASIDVSKR